MAKIGAISLLGILIVLVGVLVMSSIFSSAIISKQEYKLGEKIRLNLENYGDYRIKIITPSTSFIRVGTNDVFVFEPEETGDYTLELWRGGGKQEYYFKVRGQQENGESEEIKEEEVQEETEEDFGKDAIIIGEEVKWGKQEIIQSTGRTKISLPEAAENIKI